ncbi:MAG: uroporphyrinogen-III C-methyltransferase [Gammaproteobacteria bacterium]|nr:uroporphyrinogen-III C-methyltransferase [Gammaproteobacteria bacterium]
MENKTTQQEVIQDAEVISVESNKTQAKSRFVWVAVLILLCLQAGSFWLWNQQRLQSDDLNQQLSTVMVSLSDSSKLERSLKESDSRIQKQLSGLGSKQSSLADSVKDLSESQQITRGDVEQYWALAEVEYLLNIANQRVLLAKDVVGAHEVLEMADDRIEALSDYRLHPLRALLADELLALSSVVNVDVDGMALQLQSALDNIDDLQVLMSSPITEGDASEMLTSDNWQGALDQAWQEVKSLVVIRHQQEGAAAILVPEQRYFLYQNLRLKLETARFALLSGQSSSFETSLASATHWLKQYFVGEDRDAMLVLVAELQSTNTAVIVPDISASLSWVKGFER